MGDKTTRREFLKQMALTGAALTALPCVVQAAGELAKEAGGKSRVVISTDNTALTSDYEAVQAVVTKMLHMSMAKLTDSKTGTEAWKKLFSSKDIVGIKVNCLCGKLVSTRPEVVRAVITGLKMAGVDENNIIVWDRSSADMVRCGFKPNKSGPGVKYFADDDDWGPTMQQGVWKGRITKVISEKVTAIVNMPILKTHHIAGLSCCLKNHYGSFDNPGDYHGNNCDPAVADFNSIPMVKDKARLFVVDALRPQHSGGPQLQEKDQFNYYSMMVSNDPVAADYQGLQIIQTKLAELGKEPIPASKTPWLGSAQERGVGTCDPKKIELVQV